MSETVKINLDKLKELERKAAKLDALEAGGVDNWEGYSESIKEYHKALKHKQGINALVISIFEILSDGLYEPSESGAGFDFTEESQRLVFEELKNRIEKLRDAT